ncbi:hypothetical protein FOY91_05495 [Sphingomonas solaris]|uniref:Uncharacterized protein n=2 Tax=Alterirhizorhabdus solaris TaxID=2529389 RepID=A0A558R9K6_9SPHN|nr:hypothetical protein FOY91_05495 [Sphingomonas solaris]
MRAAPRCLAKTRRGTECQSPAIKGRKRCRVHGGARGSGAPKGERNGAYRTGEWTGEAVELRHSVGVLIKAVRAVLDDI